MSTKKEYYTTIGSVQDALAEHYNKFHTTTSFLAVLIDLFQNNKLLESKPLLHLAYDRGILSLEEFEAAILQLPILVTQIIETSHPSSILEENVIPITKDIFAYKHMPFVDDQLHTHNHFEINYVYSGSATQIFDNESRQLTEGEICIIAPYSKHDVLAYSSSLVISIMVRKSTFDTIFWSLLTQKDLLSIFFRNTLYETSQSNYLMFRTDNPEYTREIIQSIVLEGNSDDAYANSCCISWINLLFIYVLRRYSDTIQFYSYTNPSNNEFEFSLLLQYIQHNYQTVTLASLAEFFHYSEAYLSKLIKKNLKQNFSPTIRDLKMNHAVDYLTTTQLRISEISELVGYDSVDHFSRTFKDTFSLSPLEYRKTMANTKE
ncbi:MAG: AraC family transcriptional regulator [Mobilitalea sp.]